MAAKRAAKRAATTGASMPAETYGLRLPEHVKEPNWSGKNENIRPYTEPFKDYCAEWLARHIARGGRRSHAVQAFKDAHEGVFPINTSLRNQVSKWYREATGEALSRQGGKRTPRAANAADAMRDLAAVLETEQTLRDELAKVQAERQRLIEQVQTVTTGWDDSGG